MAARSAKLSAEVNRALYAKNLPFNVAPEELFELFGKFGPIRQIRQGIATNTKGTAYVVYEDVLDAKSACDKLNGFNFQNRYLVVLYHQPEKMAKSQSDLAERQENLERLKREHGIDQRRAGEPVEGEARLAEFGAGMVIGDDDRTAMKRKDSGYSLQSKHGSEHDDMASKARDFALRSEKNECVSTRPMNSTTRNAAATPMAGIPIKVIKEFGLGGVWRRMKVMAMDKQGAKA